MATVCYHDNRTADTPPTLCLLQLGAVCYMMHNQHTQKNAQLYDPRRMYGYVASCVVQHLVNETQLIPVTLSGLKLSTPA